VTPPTWQIPQTEPGDTNGCRQDKNVLPFFAYDPCRCCILGNEPGNTSLKTRQRLRRVQDSDNDGDGNSDYERCDQRALHELSDFLRGCGRVVGLHHELTQEFVRRIDASCVDDKSCLASVFLNEVQSKLIVFK